MTSPAPRTNLRAILLPALAGLLIGAVVFAFSRGGDSHAAKGNGAPLLPSALPSASGPAGSLPKEAVAEPNGTYYAVFLAVAADANDPRLLAAQRRAQALGYEGGMGELFCTAGAREQLKLSASDSNTAYSVFFDSPQHAQQFAKAVGAPVLGIAHIKAGCLD